MPKLTAYWIYHPIRDEGRQNLLDPALWPTLKSSLKHYLQALIFLTILLWLVLSLFFGATHKRNGLAYRIPLDLIDLDQGPIGQEITELIMSTPSQPSLPTWRLNKQIHTLDEARHYVKYNGWGALVINKGISDRLANALANNSQAYDPTSAITLVEQSGHQVMGQLMFVQPALQQTAQRVESLFSLKFLNDYKTRPRDASVVNFPVLMHPIGYQTENLAPFGFILAPLILPLTMLVMFLCILVPLMMLKFGSYPVYQTTRHRSLFVTLLVLIFVFCLVYSLFGTLVVLAFKGPGYNSEHLGKPITGGRFFSLWMTFLLTLLPTALWLKAIVTVFPPMFAAVPSIITVIPNMCSGITVQLLAPRFFRWFQALPFYQGGMLGRYVLTGAHPRLGENLGVLFGEMVFSTCLLYVLTLVHQRNVHKGVVDRMGNYRGSWQYIGDASKKKEPNVQSDIEVAEDEESKDASMGNETLAI